MSNSEEIGGLALIKELADEMRDCGHDVSTSDLADCLASVGMVLVRDTEGVSAELYQDHLRVTDAERNTPMHKNLNLTQRIARVFRHLRQWYWRVKAQWRRKQNGRRWLEKSRVALYARAYPDAFEFANQGLYCLRDAVETRAVQRLRKQLLDVRQKALRTMQASPVLIGK